MDKEFWKDIPGYEGLYQASDLGNIRSIDRYVDGYLGSKSFRKGKTLSFVVHPWQYYTVGLSKNNKRKTFRVHRLVLLAFVGPQPKGLVTRHLDGDKFNNRISNLCYGTFLENARDSVLHGTTKKGKSPYDYKKNMDQVTIAQELKLSGHSLREIARTLNVSYLVAQTMCRDCQYDARGQGDK